MLTLILDLSSITLVVLVSMVKKREPVVLVDYQNGAQEAVVVRER